MPGAIHSSSPGDCSQLQATASSELHIPDLELLHHYTTSTAYTFSLHPLLQTFWRVEVPRIGFTAPYTLRAILAISALHLAVLRPEQMQFYITQANTHHEAALKLATPEMANIGPDNSAPLFLLSALLSFISCAKPLKLGNFFLLENNNIADWLLLIRGTGTILDIADQSLKTGPLASMFSVRAQHRKFTTTKRHHVLEELCQLILAEVQDQHMVHMYIGTLDEMNRSYAMCLEHGLRLETADVFVWLIRVPYEFLVLLKNYEPLALIILGYFCVLLHQLEWMWCMKGWSSHLLSQIYDQLSTTHRVWIRWPMEQIGFLPPM
ncbi:putative C6 transcription factor [Aspergillus nomiae NRRL 13137]|uniref:Putative C6 transcription factor n=1 Tax=Aspergillus nomiae NRRL (strain ATCC 15546 / NRRL 13137 / CBS 260.88 / M93) TaxID=1509407 RepID=A0A0L1J1R5_ASPN3|nr:putative C6 transcription factor [Aspergillus nomiae NRRL 13137]KNG85600.1 putative C6 transcription factor [Aspergillus nomiae NRRL 13137]